MIVAIDGPAGTGKTTVAKGVAAKLKVTYFDTGALYRAVTWKMLKDGKSLNDLDSVLSDFSYEIDDSNLDKKYFVNGIDITKEIRSREVTANVSAVSAEKIVREALKPIQINFAESHDVVFEGRDLGTVVFPNAEYKFFLTAKPEIRAKRRFLELKKTIEYATILSEIKKRDQFDSERELAPLKAAQDAVLVDTSDLTIEEVIDKIVVKIR